MWGQPPSAVRSSAARLALSVPPLAETGGSSTRLDSRGRLSPHDLGLQIPCRARQVADFHKPESNLSPTIHIDSHRCGKRKGVSDAAFARTESCLCTKSGHVPVDGVHLIENTSGYRPQFLIDGKNRRSTTRSFFDSFLSFSGWCGVRGSSGVTFLIARLGKRVSEGL